MQGLEGGRGPPADFGRNRTRREETSNGTFDRRAGDLYNERGHTYDRTHGTARRMTSYGSSSARRREM